MTDSKEIKGDKDERDDIQASFNLTLNEADLEDLSIDIGEMAIDSLLEEGVLQDIPIVRTFVSLSKFGISIQDKLFAKKILSFLACLKEIPTEDRERMISKIDDSKKYRVKVGEKLLYIIDSCHDFENSERISQVFKAFVEERIDYNDFLKTADVLYKITNGDFNWFIKHGRSHIPVEQIGGLVGSGLFDMYLEDIDVDIEESEDPKFHKGKYAASVHGGDMNATLSRAGEIIMELFNPNYEKPKTVKL